TRIALTAEPGSSGSGCRASLTEPTPITGTIPAEANCGANCLTASSENPLKTSGVSIGFKKFSKFDACKFATPGPDVFSGTAGPAFASTAPSPGEWSIADFQHFPNGSHSSD